MSAQHDAPLFRGKLMKPEGRRLWLYSLAPIASDLVAPMPDGTFAPPDPHLRCHPLRGEWGNP